MSEKGEIRAEMRRQRKSVTPAERAAVSAEICARLLSLNLPGPVAVYLASPDEIDLSDFIRAYGDGLVAPRWNGEAYELAALGEDVVTGPHGILEPSKPAPQVVASEVATWIVPGLAFTREGARLGYGGGWYDRLMTSARADARKIGVGYRFQVVDALPFEPHDVLLNEIIAL